MQINTHTYWGPNYPRPELGPLGAAAAGKRLWMSEYGAGAFPRTAWATPWAWRPASPPT